MTGLLILIAFCLMMWKLGQGWLKGYFSLQNKHTREVQDFSKQFVGSWLLIAVRPKIRPFTMGLEIEIHRGKEIRFLFVNSVNKDANKFPGLAGQEIRLASYTPTPWETPNHYHVQPTDFLRLE